MTEITALSACANLLKRPAISMGAIFVRLSYSLPAFLTVKCLWAPSISSPKVENGPAHLEN